MQIRDYFNEILDVVSEGPFVESKNLSFEERSPHAAYINGDITFIDGSTLYFKEFIVIKAEAVQFKKYAYHYLSKDNSMVFRYDNALDPNAKALSTYPEHKHTSIELLPTGKPSLTEVLKEISGLIEVE